MEEKKMRVWNKVTKRIAAAVLVSSVAVTALMGCGGSEVPKETNNAEETTKGGKILLMANSSSGPMYDFNLAYMDMWT